MLLAHLSDVHLAPLPPVHWPQLVGKRITGYVNWRRNRAGSMGAAVLEALVADLAARAPDHTVVSGDLTNLALPAEIERAARWLAARGDPEAVTVVPGNHDAYVPGALRAVTAAWAPWMTGERVDGAAFPFAFPFARRRGDVAVIGCSSAEATAPLLATGPFRPDQARRLEALLEATAGLFRVVVVHHPPLRGVTASTHAMRGIELFQGAVARAGAELVLHGHTHWPTLYSIPGPRGDVPVMGVSAAGQAPGGKRPPARYNLIEIGGRPGAWRATRTERGIAPDADPDAEPRIMELGRDALAVPG